MTGFACRSFYLLTDRSGGFPRLPITFPSLPVAFHRFPSLPAAELVGCDWLRRECWYTEGERVDDAHPCTCAEVHFQGFKSPLVDYVVYHTCPSPTLHLLHPRPYTLRSIRNQSNFARKSTTLHLNVYFYGNCRLVSNLYPRPYIIRQEKNSINNKIKTKKLRIS